MIRFRTAAILVAAAAFFASLLLLSTRPAASTPSRQIDRPGLLDEVAARGTLRVGIDVFSPWTMRDRDGQLIGFEVDVARQLAQDLGVRLELVPTGWDGIIPALLARNFDIIMGGMTIRPDRNLKVNFSRPYSRNAGVVVVNARTLPRVTGIDGINRRGVTLAARRGTVSEASIDLYLDKVSVRRFDDEAAMIQEVRNGGADAYLSTEVGARQEIARSPGQLYIVPIQILRGSGEGFALRKSDPDALNYLDNWILFYTETGWLPARHHYWFQTDAWLDRVDRHDRP